jgi:general secretion pathway protein E
MADESSALETAVLFRLPFSFAKRHHVVIEANQQGWQLYYCGQLSAIVLAEVRRVVGEGFYPVALSESQFEQKLTDAYQRDSSEARQLMEDLGSDSDETVCCVKYYNPAVS